MCATNKTYLYLYYLYYSYSYTLSLLLLSWSLLKYSKFWPMFWLFSGLVACGEILSAKNNHRSVSFFSSEANTVHYIISSWDGKHGGVDPSTFKTKLEIFKNEPFSKNSKVYDEERKGLENTYFVTATTAGKYFVVFTVLDNSIKDVNLKLKIYSGAANRPHIVSTSDVEISRVERLMRDMLNRAKNDLVAELNRIQEADRANKLHVNIISKAVWIILFKMVATAATLFYSSWKTKQFYSSQYRTAIQ